MKINMYMWLVICICMPILFITSCAQKEIDNTMDNTLFNNTPHDFTHLSTLITKEYELMDLLTFFENCNANDSLCFDGSFRNLYFKEVNQHYPVEVIRPGGYSVYKVKQGGYFYVFWSSFLPTANPQEDDLCVYFTAYLATTRDADIFDSLEINASTANDVKKIDPYFELNFFMSSRIFSYSYLDEKNVLEVEYVAHGEYNGYDDLVVKEISVIPRASAPSRYSFILSDDLP